MSKPDSFKRFVAGEDALAALLRGLPQFTPPADMLTKFAAHARAAQKARRDLAAMNFEPPASLGANVFAEAARIQAAQATRQAAVLDEIKAGKPAEAVLGNRVSEATAQWLAQRAEQQAARQAQAPIKRTPRSRWQSWGPQLGVFCSFALVAGVALHVWQSGAPLPATAPELPAAAAPAGNDSQPAASYDKLDERRIVSIDMRRQKAIARAAELASGFGQVAPRQEAEAPMKEEAPVMQEKKMAELSRDAAAPATTSDNAADKLAYRPAPAPASVAAPAGPPPAAQAPAKAAAPAGATLRRAAPSVMSVQIEHAPQDTANAWLESAGHRVPHIHAAHPQSPEIKQWAEKFRLALPEDLRPAQLSVESDPALGETELRLSP